jgi:hypothetical protein
MVNTTCDIALNIDRLNPRDTFYGGRTNAIKLFHEIQQPQPGETMEYYDFTRYVCVFYRIYRILVNTWIQKP